MIALVPVAIGLGLILAGLGLRPRRAGAEAPQPPPPPPAAAPPRAVVWRTVRPPLVHPSRPYVAKSLASRGVRVTPASFDMLRRALARRRLAAAPVSRRRSR